MVVSVWKADGLKGWRMLAHWLGQEQALAEISMLMGSRRPLASKHNRQG